MTGKEQRRRMGSQDKRRRKAALIRKFGARCRVCGSGRDLTLDHIVPCSKGGSNALQNLQLLCESCNQEKADRRR